MDSSRVEPIVGTEHLASFNSIVERVYVLAQSLNIPLPPVVTNPNDPRVRPHGPAGLPVYEKSEGLVISQVDGKQWLSNWRGVRVGIDARLAQIDGAAQPQAAQLGLDTRQNPLEAPAGTPTPLREAYNSVARGLFEACALRRQPWSGAQAFEELARSFSSLVKTAHSDYTNAEMQLRAVVESDWGCAHHEALSAIHAVNDAVNHVIRGVVPEHIVIAHLQKVPAPDLSGLIRRMRQQVTRSASLKESYQLQAPQPIARIRCDNSDRSVYLDGNRVVEAVEVAVFRFFKAVAEAYPDAISYEKIAARTKGLKGKHPTRDLKDQLPRPLMGWVKSGTRGYHLELPPEKLSTIVHTS